ncbi:MAG: hypothetical protein IJ446_00740 [Oscillospiraceae bacterium]|nr:hypothetical protein [Oscillospiraceae bacterium]
MKIRAKYIFALVMTAVMLTGCGTAVDSDKDSIIPSIDKVSGEEAVVVTNKADASPDQTEGVAAANEEMGVITAAVTETPAFYDENGVKEEFDFTPEYDEEFFEGDLFIGDSITTGFSGYGILPEESVFAKIGLNPLTALDTAVTTADGDILLADKAAAVAPKRAYIMLGSNGVEWLACSNMLEGIEEIIKEISRCSPETQIVCLSVPPVTKEYDDSNEELEVMEKIHEYNSRLSEMCGDMGVHYIDITTVLEDNEGYFVHYYAEPDGVHFKPTAYKLLLSKIQYTLS